MLAVLAAAVTCLSGQIDLPTAKRWAVVAAPPLTVSARRWGSMKRAELDQTEPDRWMIRVYATGSCHNRSDVCSNLMGYYWVSKRGVVSDLFTERPARSRELSRLQHAHRRTGKC